MPIWCPEKKHPYYTVGSDSPPLLFKLTDNDYNYTPFYGFVKTENEINMK